MRGSVPRSPLYPFDILGNGRDERRLAAILAADIVGYSHLMEADESGTLAQLRTHRKEVIDPKIEEYGGRVVKTTGDGILIEFASAVDAVQTGLDVQRAMAARNAPVPTDKRIVFRVGVHLGDVIVQGDDLFGDGVNIAARLEESCEPGGVRISGTVHERLAIVRQGMAGAYYLMDILVNESRDLFTGGTGTL